MQACSTKCVGFGARSFVLLLICDTTACMLYEGQILVYVQVKPTWVLVYVTWPIQPLSKFKKRSRPQVDTVNLDWTLLQSRVATCKMRSMIIVFPSPGNYSFSTQQHIFDQQQKLDEYEIAARQMSVELEKREEEVQVMFYNFARRPGEQSEKREGFGYAGSDRGSAGCGINGKAACWEIGESSWRKKQEGLQRNHHERQGYRGNYCIFATSCIRRFSLSQGLDIDGNFYLAVRKITHAVWCLLNK